MWRGLMNEQALIAAPPKAECTKHSKNSSRPELNSRRLCRCRVVVAALEPAVAQQNRFNARDYKRLGVLKSEGRRVRKAASASGMCGRISSKSLEMDRIISTAIFLPARFG